MHGDGCSRERCAVTSLLLLRAIAVVVTGAGAGTAVGFLVGPWLAPSAADIPTLLCAPLASTVECSVPQRRRALHRRRYVEVIMACVPAVAVGAHFPAAPRVRGRV